MHKRKVMKTTETEKSRKYEWLGCYLDECPDAGTVLSIRVRANSREEIVYKMSGHGRFRIIKAEIVE